YPVIRHPQETSEEILQARENLMKSIQTFLKKFNRISFRETPKELAEYITSPSWNRHAFYDDDDEHSIQYKEYLENSSNAIAPVLPTEEPDNSLKSLLNRDILMISYPKIDSFFEEFSGELAHIDLDSDSYLEEIDLFLATDDLMPPTIENDDYDSEGDIHFLKELLSDDPLPLPKNESSNFDHHDDPSFPCPPLEPPYVEVFFDFEPDKGVLTAKVVEDISEHDVLMPKVLPSQPTLCQNIYPLLPFSFENKDKDRPNCEDSRACGFVHRLLKLQSLAYRSLIS
nr:hypothetical protein [Tanacetum cinerariifolium]